MVRQRPVVSLALAAFATIALAAFAPQNAEKSKAADPQGKAPAQAEKAQDKGTAKDKGSPRAKEQPRAKPESVDRRPYKIRVWVAIDTHARLDAKGREELVRDWQSLIRRFVGSPWDVEIAEGDGPLGSRRLDDLDPKAVGPLAQGCDKAWIIQVEPDRSGLAFSGREYDVLTARLGPTCRQPAPFPADSPRALFALSQELFEPVAEIGALSGGGVMIMVRGASLPSASEVGRIVKPGSVFKLLRIVQKADGSVVRVDEVRRSFLRVKAIEGPQARCDIISSLRDPLSKRMAARNVIVAVGVKPATRTPTRFRYLWATDKQPAAGFTLTCRTIPDGTPRELGMTDREGRIAIEPGFADDLVMFRLLAANVEPLDEFPAMPGETLTERTVSILPRSEAVTLETELNALRDELIDLVAIRARIESRLKARADANKWDEVETLLNEYKTLTPRQQYVDRLTKLRDDARRTQTETKKPILTRTAQNLITDTQALIDRYLDDEMFAAYTRALAEAKGEIAKGTLPGAGKRAVAKTKPAPRPAEVPESPTAGITQAEAAVPPAPASTPSTPKPAQRPAAPASRPARGNAVPF